LGVNQKFSDKLQTRIDINDQNILRHGSKYELNTLSIVNELDFDFSKLSLGIMNSNDKDIGNKKSIKHKDIFAQWQGLIIDNELSVGGRVIDHNDFGTHTTYNFNWARDISISSRLSASYGSATNIPNHYKNKVNVNKSKTLSIPILKPERSKNIELGIQNESNIGLIEFKVYQTKIEDAFDYIDPNSDWDGYYINSGTTDISGMELSLDTDFLGWDLSSKLDYNKAIDKASKKQKGRRPNRSISLNLSKTSGKWNRNINWTAKSRAWDKNSETTKLGGYGLLNLSTSYNFTEDLTVYLNRNNALDKDYEMARGYKTLGKTTTLGLTYNF
jgi:vitamin B12 transporter